MTTILCDISDLDSAIADERKAWLMRVLAALGGDLKILEGGGEVAKTHLAEMGIEVWPGSDGTLEVWRPEFQTVSIRPDDGEHGATEEQQVEVKRKLLAEWGKPEVVRIREGKGKEHYRISIKEWALPLQFED